MAKKADAAYVNLQSSKQVTPSNEKPASKTPKETETRKKSEAKQVEAKNDRVEKSDVDYAADNERLAQEIAAAQAVLAQLKPNVKPKGSKSNKS